MRTKILFVIIAVIMFAGCKKNPTDNSINLFSVQNDKDLGAKVNAQIQADPIKFPVLSKTQYPQAYSFVENIRNKILNGGSVYYKNEFLWEVFIIKDDSVKNAFCTPGGYIYIYTGLIKYLDAEHQLAGVLGHEMAHADRRHSTDQLTKIYGLQILLSVFAGNDSTQIASTLANMAASLVTLQFSRSNETEADTYSVKYLCPTDYRADGAAVFFQKLIAGGQGSTTPVFLSTHPDPGNRVENITSQKTTLNCTGTGTFDTAYNAFKLSLP